MATDVAKFDYNLDTLMSSAPVLSRQGRTEPQAGAYDGYLGKTIRLPPYSPDTLITQKGYTLFDDMMNSSFVRGPINLKRNAALYKPFDLIPAIVNDSDPRYPLAKEIRDECWRILNNIQTDYGVKQPFRHILWEMSRGCLTGFQLAEKHWRMVEEGPDAGKWGFQRIQALPCKQMAFMIDPDTYTPLSVTSYIPARGYRYDIPMEKIVHFVHQPVDGTPWGSADGRAIYPSYWSLMAGFKFWTVGVEQFGTPFLLGFAPKGAVYETVRKTMADIRQGAPAVFPKGIEIQLQQLGSGGMSAYESFVEAHKKEIAQLVLGSTLTTSEGARAGSNALGGVHADTQEYTVADLRVNLELAAKLQIVDQLVEYNRGPEFVDLAPNVSLGIWDRTDQLKFAQGVSLLLDRRVIDRTNPWVREQMGAPPMDSDEAAILEAKEKQDVELEKKPNPAGPSTDDGAMNGQ